MPYPILSVVDSEKVVCKVLEQVFECFGAAISKKTRICCPKMAEKSHFLAQNSVFGA